MSANEYDANKLPGKLYSSPSLPAFGNPERSVRIMSKVLSSPEHYEFAQIKKDVVLRLTDGNKKVIKATVFEDNRAIRSLNLQAFSPASGKPHSTSFSLLGAEIQEFIEFVGVIQSMPLATPQAINMTDDQLRRAILSPEQAAALLEQNESAVTEALRSRVTKADIVAVGYRRKQLDIFARLLDDDAFFEKQVARFEGPEALWQGFFERNTWMFGYGLGYLFVSGLDDSKLEQVVQGASLANYGKRADGVMKTRGAVSNLCFVEIKRHDTRLLASKPYRSGCWAPSGELSGAVAQVQGTVHSAIETLGIKFSGRDDSGNPTGEEVFNVQPKAYLVVGNLQEFRGEYGVNSDQVKSFELFRKGTSSPEIITFDELYERARFVVNHNG